MSNHSAERELEIVVWGATGYTGKLVAAYLASAPSAAGLRWAIAGRDRQKLEAVRAELKLGPEIGLMLADAGDPASLDAMCRRTRVICTTVGPYARHGSELVAACVRSGTHCCDLTGEPQWVRRMIDAHHDAAAARGVRIVHCCGFDSIPSDLGVFSLADAMRARGRKLARVDAHFGQMRGGASGGTLASAIATFEELQRDPQLRHVLTNPYALVPGGSGPDRSDMRPPYFEPRLRTWTAPFVMAAINGPIVRRSNALLDYAYGREFRYNERASTGPGPRGLARATATLGGMVAIGAALAVPPLRRAVQRRVPQPGQGPTPELRASGRYTVRMLAAADSAGPPLTLLATISDRRDPGYGSTSVMLGESALSLARDSGTGQAGVLTPASALGMPMVQRLRATGFHWTIDEAPMGNSNA